MAASCKLAPGATGRYPCNGQMKLSAGLWPLQPAPQYQGGSIHAPHSQRVPEPGSVAEVLSAAPPNGVGFEQATGKGVRQLCIWDAFGETWTNSTGGALPGQHRSIPEMWWEGFGRFLALKSDDDTSPASTDAPSDLGSALPEDPELACSGAKAVAAAIQGRYGRLYRKALPAIAADAELRAKTARKSMTSAWPWRAA